MSNNLATSQLRGFFVIFGPVRRQKVRSGPVRSYTMVWVLRSLVRDTAALLLKMKRRHHHHHLHVSEPYQPSKARAQSFPGMPVKKHVNFFATQKSIFRF